MATPRADRITLKIDAEVTEAVNKIAKVQEAYLNFSTKSKAAFQAAASAMDKFSGFAIIREATAAARAVEKIGGVAKLTAKEQEALNRTVTEAIAKYTAMGGKIPPILQRIADQTKKIDDQTRLVQASLDKISGGKLTAEANAMVAAVNKLGGATKLTAKEQETVNKLLTEAITKYAALGQKAPAEMHKLAAETKKVADETKNVQAQLEKFSGSKMIQDANNAVKAVEKLGGATKLTAAEKKTLNKELTEVIAKYRALGQSAPATIEKLRKETEQLDNVVKRGSSVWERSFFRFTAAISLADLAARGIVKVLGWIKDGIGAIVGGIAQMTMKGAEVRNIALAFESLQRGMTDFQKGVDLLGGKGQNPAETMRQLRAGSMGLITDFKLMEQANRAMLFGLNLTGNKWEELADASVKLGRAMNQSATKSMDDLVLALGRVSPRILDNLGIIVKVGEANIAWAKAHNKTVQQMTGSERVLAFQELALKKIKEHVENLGGVQLTLADRLQIANVHWQNWTNRVGEAINKSAVLQVAFSQISNAIQAVFGSGNQESVKTTVSLLEDFAIWVFKAAESMVSFARMTLQGVGVIGLGLIKFTLQINKELTAIAGKVETLARAYAFFTTGAVSDAFMKIADSMADFHVQQAKLIAGQEEQKKGFQEMAAGTDELSQNMALAVGWLKQTREHMEKAKLDAALYTEAQNDVAKATKQVVTEEAALAAQREKDKKINDKLLEDIRLLDNALKSAENNRVNATIVLKELGAKITDVSQRAQIAGVSLPAMITRWVEILDKSRPTREKFLKEMGDLEILLQTLPDDMPSEDVWELLGAQLERTANRAKAMNLTLPPLTAAWAAVGDAVKATQKEIKDFNDNLEANLAALQTYEAKLTEIADESEERTLKIGKDPDDKRALAKFQFEQAKKNIGPMKPGQFENEWFRAMAMVSAEFDRKMQDIELTWKETFTEMGKTVPMALLGAITGGGDKTAKINAVASVMGQSIQKQFFGADSPLTKKLGSIFGAEDATGKIVGGLAGKGGFLGMIGKGVASAIPFIGPLIGTFAGPIVQGMIKLFKGPSMEEKVAADLGRDYGQAFSDGLNQAVAKDAERLGDRMAASSLHLKKIIDEAGGVTLANVGKWTAKTRDIFVYLEKGIIDSEEAAKSLNEVIPALAATFEKSGGIWNAEFQELITLTKEAGIEIEAVQKLIEEQLTKMSGGTGKATKGFTDPLLKLADAADVAKKELEAAKKELDSLDKKDDKDKLVAAQDKVTEATKNAAKAQEELKKATVGSQEEFDRLSRISLRTFNTMVAEGKSPLEAMDAIGEGFDQLVKTADKLGLSGSTAFQELKRFRELTEGNRALIESIGGINDILIASINLKTLDQDAFADLEAQGLSSYQKLIAAGFTEKEALSQIAPLLGSIIEAHEQRGVAIDDETAKLIAAADQEGLLKEKQISTNEILMQGLTAIIEAVGGTIPEAWRKAAEAAEKSNNRATNATGNTEDGLSDVERKLREQQRQWDETAEAAEDANARIEDSVDGVSFGHSPGGLKEWPLMLEKSRMAMARFTRDGKRDMDDLQRQMLKTGSMAVSPTHSGAVMSHYDRSASVSRAPGPGSVVVQGDVKISTWTVNDQRDLIRKTITPEVLKTVHDGGEPGRNFTKLVRGGSKK